VSESSGGGASNADPFAGLFGGAPADRPATSPPTQITLGSLRSSIADALYPVSAYNLADECDELGFPPRDDIDEPMASKRR